LLALRPAMPAELELLRRWDEQPHVIAADPNDAAIARCFANPAVAAVLIDSLASNERAHRFYQRLGFRRVGPRRFGGDYCIVYRPAPGERQVARDMNAVARGHSIALLHGVPGEADGLGITACEVMRDHQRVVEDRVLRIVRAHAGGLLEMRKRFVSGIATGINEPAQDGKEESKTEANAQTLFPSRARIYSRNPRPAHCRCNRGHILP
jgi:hypothetical protein